MKEVETDFLSSLVEDSIWIDLQDATDEEREKVEAAFDVKFQTQQEAEEIEMSSRYIEQDGMILANSTFLSSNTDGFQAQTISFVLREDCLFTLRNDDIKAFAETVRKIKANNTQFKKGSDIMLALLESRIDMDADFVEATAKEITQIGKKLSLQGTLDEKVLLQITALQETTILIRETVFDRQRLLSSLLRSSIFPTDNTEKLRVMIKDVGSLLEHTAFSFERLEYLQNTFLGLVNIEQNKIIKIFTVVSVIFMPPTLIASVYGMNFTAMPELGWSLGYPMAIAIMIVSSVLTLLIFKKKKWL